MRSLLAAAAALSTLVGASAALTKCQVVDMLRSGGIPSQYIAPMTCTAFYESSWNPTAQHKNTDGSTDYGLFQINNVYWCYDSTHPGKVRPAAPCIMVDISSFPHCLQVCIAHNAVGVGRDASSPRNATPSSATWLCRPTAATRRAPRC